MAELNTMDKNKQDDLAKTPKKVQAGFKSATIPCLRLYEFNNFLEFHYQ